MWKQTQSSGRVTYTERYRDPLTGKLRTASVSMIPTGRKSDDKVAQKALREKIDAILSGEGVKSVTMEQLVDMYVRWEERHHKKQSARAIRYRTNTLCKLIGADVIASRLTAAVVTDRLWIDDKTTYNNRITLYKSMMRWAYSQDLIPSIDYLAKIRLEENVSERQKDVEKYLERDEIPKLTAALSDQDAQLTRFLILSGLRIGEAQALEDKDVDFAAGAVHVTKTFSREIHEISTPKTMDSLRDVPMSEELIKLCHEIRADKLRRSLQYGFRSDLFFASDLGTRINYIQYRESLAAAASSAIGRKITPHALRHTHVALLAEAGVPLETISRRLGHSNSKITQRIYMHVTNKMKEKDAELIRKVSLL